MILPSEVLELPSGFIDSVGNDNSKSVDDFELPASSELTKSENENESAVVAPSSPDSEFALNTGNSEPESIDEESENAETVSVDDESTLNDASVDNKNNIVDDETLIDRIAERFTELFAMHVEQEQESNASVESVENELSDNSEALPVVDPVLSGGAELASTDDSSSYVSPDQGVDVEDDIVTLDDWESDSELSAPLVIENEDDEGDNVESAAPDLAAQSLSYESEMKNLLSEIRAYEVHAALSTPFSEYTVTEGLLLMLLVLSVFGLYVKLIKGGFEWLR